MNLELKDVVDYVVRIRAQDVQFFSTLLTIFAGSVLAVIVISLFARGSKDETKKAEALWVISRRRRKYFATTSLILFILFLFFMRAEQTTKREFCSKWLANHISSSRDTPDVLISKFSSAHYALDRPGDHPHKVDPNDMPAIPLNCFALGNLGLLTTMVFPLAALFSLFLYLTSCNKEESSTTVSNNPPENSNTKEVDSKQQ